MIMDLMLKHAAEQNAVVSQARPMCTDDEFGRYRQMIAQSMGSILLDVMNPIIELYPDLKPPQLE
jgi:hypothetical protein